MSEVEILEMELTPIPPDTVGTVRDQLVPLITEALRSHGKQEIAEQVEVDIEETFPTSEVIVALVTLGSGVALETFKQVVLPILRDRFVVRTKPSKRRSNRPKRR